MMDNSSLTSVTEETEVDRACRLLIYDHLQAVSKGLGAYSKEDVQKATNATYVTLDTMINCDRFFPTLDASREYMTFWREVQDKCTWAFANLYGSVKDSNNR